MRIFLLLVLCLIISSCSTKKKQPEMSFSVISMENISFKSKLIFSEFVEHIEVIPLETTSESLIGEIKRIIHRNGRYYMLVTNGYSNARVLVFDDLGKFLLKIDKVGQGRGEYLDMADFALTSNAEIKIAAYKKIVTYDSIGNYVREKPINNYAREIHLMSNDKYIMSHFDLQAHHNKALCLIDAKDDVLTEFFKLPSNEMGKLESFLRLNTFVSSGKNLYFNYPLCDTIFSIKGRDVLPAYYVDFGTKKIDYSLVEAKDDALGILNKISSKEYLEILGFQICSDFLCLEIGNNENDAFLAFCFKDNRMVGGHYVVDDMFFKNNYISLKYKYMPRNMDGDYLLWPLPAFFLLNGYKQYKAHLSSDEWKLFCEKNRKLVEICESLSEEDNPVLLRIKVKK